LVENDPKETFDGLPSNFNTNNGNKGVFIGGSAGYLKGPA
jgi:hypothetical protein